jgi:hypothetical protein
MAAPGGELVLLFNHGSTSARVDATLPLARPAGRVRELTTEVDLPAAGASSVRLAFELPAESVRVYRVDYR